MSITILDSEQDFATFASSILFSFYFWSLPKYFKVKSKHIVSSLYPSMCVFFKNRTFFLQAHNEVNQTIIYPIISEMSSYRRFILIEIQTRSEHFQSLLIKHNHSPMSFHFLYLELRNGVNYPVECPLWYICFLMLSWKLFLSLPYFL